MFYLAAQIVGDLNDPNLNASNMVFKRPFIFSHSSKQTASTIAYQYRIKNYHRDINAISSEVINESMKLPVIVTSLAILTGRESHVLVRSLGSEFTYDNILRMKTMFGSRHKIFIEGQITDHSLDTKRLFPNWLVEQEKHTLIMAETDHDAIAVDR